MKTINWIQLMIALVFGTIMLFPWKRNKSKANMGPRFFGVWGGIDAFVLFFVLFMAGSIMQRPIAELFDYTTENFLWSFALGIWAYFCGRVLVRRMPAKE